jgi:hypothetical protein
VVLGVGQVQGVGLAIGSASRPSRSRNWQCGITLRVKGNGADQWLLGSGFGNGLCQWFLFEVRLMMLP